MVYQIYSLMQTFFTIQGLVNYWKPWISLPDTLSVELKKKEGWKFPQEETESCMSTEAAMGWLNGMDLVTMALENKVVI